MRRNSAYLCHCSASYWPRLVFGAEYLRPILCSFKATCVATAPSSQGGDSKSLMELDSSVDTTDGYNVEAVESVLCLLLNGSNGAILSVPAGTHHRRRKADECKRQ